MKEPCETKMRSPDEERKEKEIDTRYSAEIREMNVSTSVSYYSQRRNHIQLMFLVTNT